MLVGGWRPYKKAQLINIKKASKTSLQIEFASVKAPQRACHVFFLTTFFRFLKGSHHMLRIQSDEKIITKKK